MHLLVYSTKYIYLKALYGTHKIQTLKFGFNKPVSTVLTSVCLDWKTKVQPLWIKARSPVWNDT